MHGYIYASDNGDCSKPGKFEVIRSQEFMPSEARQKFLKKNDYFRA